MIYHFDQFELDMARFELREEGAVQALEPQVFTLLAYLIEHRERLVPKTELFENLWDGRVVTDSALTSRIKLARQALGDTGKAQQFIKTIYGKGFRFIGDVWFADDLAPELISELARLRWLLAITTGGMDSVRSPFKRTACVCHRCATLLNSGVLRQPESRHVELKLVKPANNRSENRTLGRFGSESSG